MFLLLYHKGKGEVANGGKSVVNVRLSYETRRRYPPPSLDQYIYTGFIRGQSQLNFRAKVDEYLTSTGRDVLVFPAPNN